MIFEQVRSKCLTVCLSRQTDGPERGGYFKQKDINWNG